MPEAEIVGWLYKVAPALAVVVWVMIRQERMLNRVTSQYEETIKSVISIVNKNTEAIAQNSVHIGQANELKSREKGG